MQVAGPATAGAWPVAFCSQGERLLLPPTPAQRTKQSDMGMQDGGLAAYGPVLRIQHMIYMHVSHPCTCRPSSRSGCQQILPSAAGELKAFFHQVRKESPEQETLCLECEYRGSQETGPVLCRAPLQQRSAVPRPHIGQSCASRCPTRPRARMHPLAVNSEV